MMMISLNSLLWTFGKTSKYLWIDTHEKVTSLLLWHAWWSVCCIGFISCIHLAKSPPKTFGKGEALKSQYSLPCKVSCLSFNLESEMFCLKKTKQKTPHHLNWLQPYGTFSESCWKTELNTLTFVAKFIHTYPETTLPQDILHWYPSIECRWRRPWPHHLPLFLDYT